MITSPAASSASTFATGERFPYANTAINYLDSLSSTRLASLVDEAFAAPADTPTMGGALLHRTLRTGGTNLVRAHTELDAPLRAAAALHGAPAEALQHLAKIERGALEAGSLMGRLGSGVLPKEELLRGTAGLADVMRAALKYIG